MDIFEEVKKAICKVHPGVDQSKLVWDASLKDDLGMSSLAKVELALAIEDTFGFYLSDEELGEINTVGDVVSFIESKAKA